MSGNCFYNGRRAQKQRAHRECQSAVDDEDIFVAICASETKRMRRENEIRKWREVENENGRFVQSRAGLVA